MTKDLTIRPMSRAELDLAVDWAAAEGWNPGLHDADCFYRTDPGGFLLGSIGDEPIGCISVVAYSPTFAFLGLYIVRPGMRGKGHGLRIWQAGMARLGGSIIGLDGVVAQQDNYRKSGFLLAYRNIRYGGSIAPAGPLAAKGVVELSQLPFERVLAYDRPLFQAPREEFLRCWLDPTRRSALGLVRDGALVGYGVIRRCREGFKIGPLFADDEAAAEALFQALSARAGGEPVFLDLPEPNRSAVALAERHGLAPVFETARMYRGPAPAADLARIFGVTTFELG